MIRISVYFSFFNMLSDPSIVFFIFISSDSIVKIIFQEMTKSKNGAVSLVLLHSVSSIKSWEITLYLYVWRHVINLNHELETIFRAPVQQYFLQIWQKEFWNSNSFRITQTWSNYDVSRIDKHFYLLQPMPMPAFRSMQNHGDQIRSHFS